MKLSVNIENLLGRYPFETSARLYREAGFDAIDYPLFGMINDDSPYLGDGWRTLAEKNAETAKRLGLEINQTHAPFAFSYDLLKDPDSFRNTVFPRIVRSIEISAALGARIVVVHPLHHISYAGNEEELFEMNMKFYRELIPVCRSCGIAVGVENMWEYEPQRKVITHDTCSKKEEFVRYIDTLDSEYAVACLDLGHVGLPVYGEEAQDVIEALGHDRLKALHVHDNDYRNDAHDLPFMGKMNWAAITAALGKIRYAGDFTYEVTTQFMRGADDAFIPVGLKYMEQIGRNLIRRIESASEKI